ncbi:hypothetical protein HK102_004002, partial [Quaeritorhiza haematococci]
MSAPAGLPVQTELPSTPPPRPSSSVVDILSDDLWLQICDYLASDSYKNLVALESVSRRFFSLSYRATSGNEEDDVNVRSPYHHPQHHQEQQSRREEKGKSKSTGTEDSEDFSGSPPDWRKKLVLAKKTVRSWERFGEKAERARVRATDGGGGGGSTGTGGGDAGPVPMDQDTPTDGRGGPSSASDTPLWSYLIPKEKVCKMISSAFGGIPVKHFSYASICPDYCFDFPDPNAPRDRGLLGLCLLVELERPPDPLHRDPSSSLSSSVSSTISPSGPSLSSHSQQPTAPLHHQRPPNVNGLTNPPHHPYPYHPDILSISRFQSLTLIVELPSQRLVDAIAVPLCPGQTHPLVLRVLDRRRHLIVLVEEDEMMQRWSKLVFLGLMEDRSDRESGVGGDGVRARWLGSSFLSVFVTPEDLIGYSILPYPRKAGPPFPSNNNPTSTPNEPQPPPFNPTTTIVLLSVSTSDEGFAITHDYAHNYTHSTYIFGPNVSMLDLADPYDPLVLTGHPGHNVTVWDFVTGVPLLRLASPWHDVRGLLGMMGLG